MRFAVASNNGHKLKEIGNILERLGCSCVSQKELGLVSEPEETGGTFEENALIKARALSRLCGLPVVADDSGLEVDALGGAPGIYSARYEGLGSDRERTMRLLENMRGVTDRRARFVACVACVLPDGREITAVGTCEGSISAQPSGDGGFGYDPAFLPDGWDKSFAAMSEEEKDAISHRGAALRLFVEKIKGIIDADR